ncbi:hypothetical protein [Haladaptatus sp. DJG-WS-42]|uniref:DUF7093 family protein n=1 Tax=Haladaptatus sp. DJG-WS-42 TaxID=3120516 RepID=UPI0030D51493
MSLKCSLLGHRYGELEVEREREERGSEVVVTVREVEVCDRCGNTQIRSEAKEVTTMETGTQEPAPESEPEPPHDDAAVVTEPDDAEVEPADDTDEADQLPAEPADEDVEIIDEHEAADVGHDTAPNLAEVEQYEELDDLDPEQDDGIILTDDEDEVPQRNPGEWPDEPERVDPKDTSWVRNGDGEGDDAAADLEAPAPATGPGEGHFHCPKCNFETEVRESPLREGDICPSCKQGYLDRVATRKE